MPAVIDTTDGVSSFVSANTDAWHRLGTTVEGTFDANVAMKTGHLGGWNVRKEPMYITVGGKTIQVPDRVAIIRDNPVRKGQIDVLGDTGERYEIVQNEAHAELLNTLVDESGAHFETAGSLEQGKKVFITMKLPGHINVGGVDPVENYIAAVNSHDGTLAFTLMVTPVRIVCANTLNMAFRNRSHIHRIRHTSQLEKNLQAQAREALDISFNYLDDFQAEAEQLINTTLTDIRFEEIVTKAFGAPDEASMAAQTRSETKIGELMHLFTEAGTQAGIRNTAWAGLNALTEWADHLSPTRGDDRENSRAAKAIMDPTFKNVALRLMQTV